MKALVGLVFCLVAAVSAVRIPEEAERVVGGGSVKEGDYPFNAAIHYKKIFLCSGAFIGAQYIITTADCVYPYSTGSALSDLTIKLGSIKSAHETGVFNYGTALVSIHPNYARAQQQQRDARDFTIHYFNIAVITLTMSVIITPTIGPVILPAIGSSPVPDGDTLDLVGWGHRHGLVSDNLEAASLATTDVAICILLSGGNPSVNPGNMLCTAAYDPSNNSQEGACTMDHGAPLVKRGTITYLHGLVSWADCEWENGGIKPTIYTSILAHRAWIGGIAGL